MLRVVYLRKARGVCVRARAVHARTRGRTFRKMCNTANDSCVTLLDDGNCGNEEVMDVSLHYDSTITVIEIINISVLKILNNPSYVLMTY